MNNSDLSKHLLAIFTLLLGGLICLSSFFPFLRNNYYCIGLIIICSLGILIYIIKEAIKSRDKKKMIKQKSTQEDQWKTLAVSYILAGIDDDKQEQVAAFLLIILRMIENCYQFKDVVSLKKIICAHIVCPIEHIIKEITPYSNQEEIDEFSKKEFSSKWDSVKLKLFANLNVF